MREPRDRGVVVRIGVLAALIYVMLSLTAYLVRHPEPLMVEIASAFLDALTWR